MARHRKRMLIPVGVSAVGLIVAACGGSSSSSTPQPPPATATPTLAPRPAATPTPVPATRAPSPSPASGPTATAAPTTAPAGPAAFKWSFERVDRGTKPALALTSSGTPYVAYMLEDMRGFVKNAVRKSGGSWDVATIANGYFYGPLDIAIGPDDVAHVSYHDHQDPSQVRPDKGDAAYAVFRNGKWTVTAITTPIHDGWDNRIAVDAQGRPRISAVSPVDFGGSGVEYYELNADGKWTVDQKVGSGPITYRWGTSIAIDPQGNSHISYYAQDNNDLAVAHRGPSGWTIERVDTQGDTGAFSSMVIDKTGRFHISYMELSGGTRATVKYATRGPNDAKWTIQEIDRLSRMRLGFTGARNSTSVVVDANGNPWVAYTDESVIKLAVFDGSKWQTSTVAQAGSRPFGQLVSLKLDTAGAPHLAYFEVTNSQQLDGIVMYAIGAR